MREMSSIKNTVKGSLGKIKVVLDLQALLFINFTFLVLVMFGNFLPIVHTFYNSILLGLIFLGYRSETEVASLIMAFKLNVFSIFMDIIVLLDFLCTHKFLWSLMFAMVIFILHIIFRPICCMALNSELKNRGGPIVDLAACVMPSKCTAKPNGVDHNANGRSGPATIEAGNI